MGQFVLFLTGAVCMGYAVAGLFFMKYWRRTGDHLFFTFALAFWVLGALRAILSMLSRESELRWYLFCFRLLAFLLILLAIYLKNRGSMPQKTVE